MVWFLVCHFGVLVNGFCIKKFRIFNQIEELVILYDSLIIFIVFFSGKLFTHAKSTVIILYIPYQF